MFLPKKKESGYETITRLQRGPVGVTEFVEINGDDASKLLEMTSNCRGTRACDVRKIEDSIREHGFRQYEKPLSFSSEGREDGAHRLAAIRNVGGEHTVWVAIVPPQTGVSPSYDSGRKRNIADIALVNGVDLTGDQWATVNLFSAALLGGSVRPHEKHELYQNLKDGFDESFDKFKKLPKGRHHCFRVCYVMSGMGVSGVSESTRQSLRDFSLWLNSNYEFTVDSKGGAVCVKLAKDFSETGNHQTHKCQVVRDILRYSIGRKWEKQKDRSNKSPSVARDIDKVNSWIGGLR